MVTERGIKAFTMTNLAAGRSPSFAMRMADASKVLMRGLAANLAGKAWRHVGQVFLPCPTHLLKHPRQKLCWQGACQHTGCIRLYLPHFEESHTDGMEPLVCTFCMCCMCLRETIIWCERAPEHDVEGSL